MLAQHRVPSKNKLTVLLQLEQQGILLIPSRWDTSPTQGTQQEATKSTELLKQLGILLFPYAWDASATQVTYHETTRSITTPGMLVHHRIPSIKQLRVITPPYYSNVYVLLCVYQGCS